MRTLTSMGETMEVLDAYIYTYNYGEGKTVLRVTAPITQENTLEKVLKFLANKDEFLYDDNGQIMPLYGFRYDVQISNYKLSSNQVEVEIAKESETLKRLSELEKIVNETQMALVDVL